MHEIFEEKNVFFFLLFVYIISKIYCITLNTNQMFEFKGNPKLKIWNSIQHHQFCLNRLPVKLPNRRYAEFMQGIVEATTLVHRFEINFFMFFSSIFLACTCKKIKAAKWASSDLI